VWRYRSLSKDGGIFPLITRASVEWLVLDSRFAPVPIGLE